MKKYISVFLGILCFLSVSCTGLFADKTAGGKLKVTLPEVKNANSSSRAADDVTYEFNLKLVNEAGEETVRTGKNGETIVFESIDPGVYTISCGATINEVEYFGSKEKVEVVSGTTTTVTLGIKRVTPAEPEKPEEPVVYVPGIFNYDESTGEYKFYFRSEDVPAFEKGNLIKFTYSGTPDKDFKGGMSFNYYGWNEEAKKYQGNSDFINVPKTDFKAGQKIVETVYFFVPDAFESGMKPSFDMYYHPEQLKESFKLEGFTCSFEKVDQTPSSRVKVSSSEQGVRFEISKFASDKYWSDVRIKNIKTGTFVKAADYTEEKVVLYWPFSPSSAPYKFALEGVYGADDVYKYEEIACAHSLYEKDTGVSLDNTLVDKWLDSSTVIADKADSKLIRLKTDLKSEELNKILNVASDYYLNCDIVSGEWTWHGSFILKDKTDISNYITSGIDYLKKSVSGKDKQEVFTSLEGTQNYRVVTTLWFSSDKYSKQYFVLPDCKYEAAVFTKPTSIYMERDENNCCVTRVPVNKSLKKGDYVMITLSGTIEYQVDKSTEIEPTEIMLGLQDTSLNDYWMNPVTPWRVIGYKVPNGKSFTVQGGFYIERETTDKTSFQLNFYNNTKLSELLLKYSNYKSDIKVYPSKINDKGQTVSTIKLIDYTTVTSDYQLPITISLPIPDEVVAYDTKDAEYTLQIQGSPSVSAYTGSLYAAIQKNYDITTLEDCIIGYQSGEQFIKDSTVAITTIEKEVNGKNVKVPVINTPEYTLKIPYAIDKNYTVYVVLSLISNPNLGLDFITDDAVIDDFIFTVKKK